MTVFEKKMQELIEAEGWKTARDMLCNMIENCNDCPLNSLEDCSEDEEAIEEALTAEV